MDWNHDGKHDWKDDSFFHNVVMKDSEKQEGSKSNSKTSYSGSSSTSSSNGLIWFIVLCVVYFIIKLIA